MAFAFLFLFLLFLLFFVFMATDVPMETMQAAPEPEPDTETETETETERETHPLDPSPKVPAHRAIGAEDTPRSRPMYMPRRGVIPGDLRGPLEDSEQAEYLHCATLSISPRPVLLGSLIGEGGGGGGGRVIEGALAALRRQELSAGTRGLDTPGWERERHERRDFEMQATSLFPAPNTPQGPSTSV
jgi:hypothetical protein